MRRSGVSSVSAAVEAGPGSTLPRIGSGPASLAKKSKNYIEEQLQKQVAEYLDLALPDDSVWFHVPNQRGTRKRWENELLKAMGVKAGIPDCVIIWRGDVYCIELKAPKGTLSDAQSDMMRYLWSAGIKRYEVCRSVTEVQIGLELWGIPLKAKLT